MVNKDNSTTRGFWHEVFHPRKGLNPFVVMMLGIYFIAGTFFGILALSINSSSWFWLLYLLWGLAVRILVVYLARNPLF